MSGLSKTNKLGSPYITSGDRAYCIGYQDGSFPKIGWHSPGEMTGIWAPAIKLADGFNLTISYGGRKAKLEKADRYSTYPYGNSFYYYNVLDGLDIERFQFVPQGLPGIVIEYQLKNNTQYPIVLTLDFSVSFHLFPCWLAEKNGIIDGLDIVKAENGKLWAKDVINGWAAACSSSLKNARAIPSSLTGSICIPADGKKIVRYCISGSSKDNDVNISRSLKEALKNADHFLRKKKEYLSSVISNACITIPNEAIQDAYTYSKINTAWMERRVDEMYYYSAGFPEYPWLFGTDNEYTAPCLAATGQPEAAKKILTTLKNVSDKANGNGRIIHEANFFGHVYNYGNTQETAQFAIAVSKVFKWTGDIEWLSSLYPYMKKGLEWLFNDMDTNGNLFPEGYGIVEIQDLNAELLDVAVYSQKALECMSWLATVMGEKENSDKWASMASELKAQINDKFWDQEAELYCDFYATAAQAVNVVRGSEKQERESIFGVDMRRVSYYDSLAHEFAKLPPNLEKGFLSNINWVVSTPLETGIVPEKRAVRLLDKIRNEHCCAYGPFLSVVNRDYSMTILNGVQAVAEAQYGRIDNALEYLQFIASTLHYALPGSIYECMPDMGCCCQEWTIYGPATVLIEFIFGIEPDAINKTVRINPTVPAGWNELSIENVTVGNLIFSLTLKRNGEIIEASVKKNRNDWIILYDNSVLK